MGARKKKGCLSMKKLHKILLIFILIIISVPTVNGMKEFYDYNLNKSYYQIVTNLPEQDMRNLNYKIIGISGIEDTYEIVEERVLQTYPNDYTKNEFVKNKIYKDKYLVFVVLLPKSKINKIKQNKNILVIKNLGKIDPFRVEMH
jgi:hypothetical protein